MSSGRTVRPKLTKEQRLSENKRLRIASKDFNAGLTRLGKEHNQLMKLTRAVSKGGKLGAKTQSGKTVFRKDVEKLNHEWVSNLRMLSKHYSAALHKKRPSPLGAQTKFVRAKFAIRKFFNEINTPDVNWDKLMAENGPNAELLKNGITNNKIITNLFTLYYFSGVLPDGKPLVSQNKENQCVVRVMEDPLFKECFGKTITDIEARGARDGTKKFDPYNFKYKHFRNIISMNIFKKGETVEVTADGKKWDNPAINETQELKDTLTKAYNMVVEEKLEYRKRHQSVQAKKKATKKKTPVAVSVAGGSTNVPTAVAAGNGRAR